jgi:hypothetical protein
MTNAHKITLALALCLTGVVAFVGYAWIKEHEANAVLAAQEKVNKAAADAILTREKANQQQLADALKTYVAMKQQVQTPAQVVKALSQVIKLGEPIRQVTPEQAKAVEEIPDGPKEGDLIIPGIDAKAFYDTQVDCKANEVKLASCQVTVANQESTIAIKDTQIEQDHQALKGGTKWQRTKTALKWLGAGAATGAVVALVVEHH